MEPLTRLAEFRKLPAHVLEELHELRADVHFNLHHFTEARRHLTAAIAVRPLEARHHYMMAIAIEEDATTDRKRAQMYFERAIQIEPDNAGYWVDFGSYLFTLDKVKDALKAIRKAYALASGDVETIGRVAEVLRREGYLEEATTKLRAALFENHGAAAFRQLWQQHQFAMIHAQQQEKREKSANAKPMILKFTPAPTQGKYLELGGKTIRIDQAEAQTGPTEKKPVPYKRPPKG